MKSIKIVKKGDNMDKTDSVVKKQIKTWLKNRYAEFFTYLLCSTEPKIINATEAVDVVLKFNYRIAPADIYVIGKKIEKGTASDKEKKLFFEIKELRRYAVDYNVTLKRISKTSMKSI
jgi:hypothetical protein